MINDPNIMRDAMLGRMNAAQARRSLNTNNLPAIRYIENRDHDLIEEMAIAINRSECAPHAAETGYGELWGWEKAMPAVKQRCRRAAQAALDAYRANTPTHRKGE